MLVLQNTRRVTSSIKVLFLNTRMPLVMLTAIAGNILMEDLQQEEALVLMPLHLTKTTNQLLFSSTGRESTDDRVDGVFDPFRIMNAYLLGLGYEIESNKFGNIKAELFYSSLLQAMPDDVKEDTASAETKMVGYYGKDIGYELDVTYSYLFDRGLELGTNLAAAMPGDAWKIKEDKEPENNYLVQALLLLTSKIEGRHLVDLFYMGENIYGKYKKYLSKLLHSIIIKY